MLRRNKNFATLHLSHQSFDAPIVSSTLRKGGFSPESQDLGLFYFPVAFDFRIERQ
jgi:hypothetical protein